MLNMEQGGMKGAVCEGGEGAGWSGGVGSM